MSVVEFASGDLFIARVFKNHINNPSDVWVNSYEFKSTEAGTIGVVIDLCEKLVNFEIAVHLAVVNFVRVTFSTWEEDSKPYDPATFFSTTTTGVGTNVDSAAPLGLNNCLSVSRVPISGRFGHMFYRGVPQKPIQHWGCNVALGEPLRELFRPRNPLIVVLLTLCNYSVIWRPVL